MPLIALLFFYSINVKSQNSNGIAVTNQSHRLISVKSNTSPAIFQVNNKKYKATVNTSRKKMTNEYKYALERFNLALMDSIEASRNGTSSVFKKEALEEISMYINNFLESKEDYEFKKEALMDAQKISNKYSFGYLLYADDETNTHYEDKFFILSNKKSEMKSYLKRILDRVESDMDRMSIRENNKLEQARKKLNAIKKYEIIEGGANVKNYSMYTLGSALPNPGKVISGNFETLGRYYVLKNGVKGYMPNQLVSAIDVRAKKINKTNFLFKNSSVLVKNRNTNETFLVMPGLINQYQVN